VGTVEENMKTNNVAAVAEFVVLQKDLGAASLNPDLPQCGKKTRIMP
jgi:hypothetical protein